MVPEDISTAKTESSKHNSHVNESGVTFPDDDSDIMHDILMNLESNNYNSNNIRRLEKISKNNFNFLFEKNSENINQCFRDYYPEAAKLLKDAKTAFRLNNAIFFLQDRYPDSPADSQSNDHFDRDSCAKREKKIFGFLTKRITGKIGDRYRVAKGMVKMSNRAVEETDAPFLAKEFGVPLDTVKKSYGKYAHQYRVDRWEKDRLREEDRPFYTKLIEEIFMHDRMTPMVNFKYYTIRVLITLYRAIVSRLRKLVGMPSVNPVYMMLPMRTGVSTLTQISEKDGKISGKTPSVYKLGSFPGISGRWRLSNALALHYCKKEKTRDRDLSFAKSAILRKSAPGINSERFVINKDFYSIFRTFEDWCSLDPNIFEHAIIVGGAASKGLDSLLRFPSVKQMRENLSLIAKDLAGVDSNLRTDNKNLFSDPLISYLLGSDQNIGNSPSGGSNSLDTKENRVQKLCDAYMKLCIGSSISKEYKRLLQCYCEKYSLKLPTKTDNPMNDFCMLRFNLPLSKVLDIIKKSPDKKDFDMDNLTSPEIIFQELQKNNANIPSVDLTFDAESPDFHSGMENVFRILYDNAGGHDDAKKSVHVDMHPGNARKVVSSLVNGPICFKTQDGFVEASLAPDSKKTFILGEKKDALIPVHEVYGPKDSHALNEDRMYKTKIIFTRYDHNKQKQGNLELSYCQYPGFEDYDFRERDRDRFCAMQECFTSEIVDNSENHSVTFSCKAGLNRSVASAVNTLFIAYQKKRKEFFKQHPFIQKIREQNNILAEIFVEKFFTDNIAVRMELMSFFMPCGMGQCSQISNQSRAVAQWCNEDLAKKLASCSDKELEVAKKVFHFLNSDKGDSVAKENKEAKDLLSYINGLAKDKELKEQCKQYENNWFKENDKLVKNARDIEKFRSLRKTTGDFLQLTREKENAHESRTTSKSSNDLASSCNDKDVVSSDVGTGQMSIDRSKNVAGREEMMGEGPRKIR